MKPISRPFIPIRRDGIAIDLIAIAANLFVFPLLTAYIGDLFDHSFANNEPAFNTLSGLMLVILAFRLTGLYLKRFPLHARHGGDAKTSFPAHFVLLNIGVVVLNSAFVVIFMLMLLTRSGIVESGYGNAPKDSAAVAFISVFTMLSFMAAESYLLFRLGKPLTEKEKELQAAGDRRFGPMGEWAADFGLFAYMVVWQVFYNGTARIFMTTAENVPETLDLKIFGAVFTFICFLIFYVSPRTVFLIEDRKHIGTWISIFGVYLSSIIPYIWSAERL